MLIETEQRFVVRMRDLGERITWIRIGANGADAVGTLPTNDFVWHSRGGVEVEHNALAAETPVDLKHLARQVTNALVKNKRSRIVHTVLLDVGARSVPVDVVADLADYNRLAVRPLGALWLLSASGLIEIRLKSEWSEIPS